MLRVSALILGMLGFVQSADSANPRSALEVSKISERPAICNSNRLKKRVSRQNSPTLSTVSSREHPEILPRVSVIRNRSSSLSVRVGCGRSFTTSQPHSGRSNSVAGTNTFSPSLTKLDIGILDCGREEACNTKVLILMDLKVENPLPKGRSISSYFWVM